MSKTIEFKTERLKLRPIDQKDSEAVFKYRSDSITNQFQGWIPKTIEDVHEFIKKVSPKINIENTWFQFVIIKKSNNEIIGDVGIHFCEVENKQVEIGITLDKNEHGKGFATETLKEIINYLFSTLDKQKIVCSIDPQNVKSIKLVESLGFIKEAHLKESLLLNNLLVDELIYSIVQKE